MIYLPDVTVVAITTRDYGLTMLAIKKTLQHIKPAEVLYFSDIPYQSNDFDHVLIPKMDWNKYNEFVVKELYKYIETSHVLLIQHDGYVLDGTQWTDEFLKYDYIGAPWVYKDGRNVGNGGFSLRSRRLQEALANDKSINIYSPEDEIIGRLYRPYLEKVYEIKFAPEQLAHKFSFELNRPWQKTFGFHGYHNEPYKEPIILKRTGAMGDVIMMEPIMEYYHKKDRMVVLDTNPSYMDLFQNHFYPVYHVNQFDSTNGIECINLDMSYEINPKQLAIKSYLQTCGISEEIRLTPKLNFPCDERTKMFKKYIVLHIDDTDMPHRNIHGVNWECLIEVIEAFGYSVIRIGRSDVDAGLWMNTPTKQMMMYLLSGADFFIGIDSGPAQVAVALGVKSVIFFGSVSPHTRYADMTNIAVIQNACPIGQDGCYHDVISTVGQKCAVDEKMPPCISHGPMLVSRIIDALSKLE